MRVLLAGGGSAGHTSPLLATADALRRVDPDIEITCLGTERGLETTVIPKAGYRPRADPAGAAAASPSVELAKVPFRFRAAVKAARAVIDDVQPDVVVGFGGYVCTPAYLAARTRQAAAGHPRGQRPAGPGQPRRCAVRRRGRDVVPRHQAARRACSSGCRSVARSRPSTGRPARPGPRPLRTARPMLPTLLVTGGSQGARRINGSVSAASRELAAAGVQVLHVKGPKGEVELPADRGDDAPPYVVVPYVDRMDLAYAAADATVGRSGANSVTEAAAVGLPAVFVPLPIGNGEQALNAAAVVSAGGAMLVDDEDFTPEWVREHLPALLTDADRLAAMGGRGVRADPPRRRRRAGPSDPGGGAPMIIAVPDRDPAGRGAGSGALRRHRRSRAVRAGPHHGAARRHGHRQRRQGSAGARRRCASSASSASSGTRRGARRRRRHGRRLDRRPGRQPRGGAGPGARRRGCGRGRPPSSR